MNGESATAKTLTVYTDGSSRGNPGPGGWSGIIITDNQVYEIGGNESNTTNNRMELQGPLSSLFLLRDKISNGSISLPGIVNIYSDSQYVIKGMTEWKDGWIYRGWKTANKKPVLNQDLWQSLIGLSDQITQEYKLIIYWYYVKGHAGQALNERCDSIATSFADNEPIDLYCGSREGYHIEINF